MNSSHTLWYILFSEKPCDQSMGTIPDLGPAFSLTLSEPPALPLDNTGMLQLLFGRLTCEVQYVPQLTHEVFGCLSKVAIEVDELDANASLGAGPQNTSFARLVA